MGESTLVDVDDARIQSLEEVVTEADELIEKGSESGARRLLLAELAAIRLVTKAGGTCRRLQCPTARCPWEQHVVGQWRFCVADQHHR